MCAHMSMYIMNPDTRRRPKHLHIHTLGKTTRNSEGGREGQALEGLAGPVGRVDWPVANQPTIPYSE